LRQSKEDCLVGVGRSYNAIGDWQTFPLVRRMRLLTPLWPRHCNDSLGWAKAMPGVRVAGKSLREALTAARDNCYGG
jgi:hypothetical protein